MSLARAGSNPVRALREKLEADGWRVVDEEWDRLEANLLGVCEDQASPALREQLDGLRPVRGLAYGCALSLGLWAAIAVVTWLVLG